MIDDGGPAFPVSIPGVGDNGAPGMSLRDWFAGLAIVRKLPTSATKDEALERCAQAAYRMADAMLKARQPKPTTETYTDGLRVDPPVEPCKKCGEKGSAVTCAPPHYGCPRIPF
jgi:hypothetical protein